MDLAAYLERENIKPAVAAKQLGMPRVTFGQYVKRQRRPQRQEDIQKIVDWTKGDVTANDLYFVKVKPPIALAPKIEAATRRRRMISAVVGKKRRAA
jgi:hypothetical protein